MSVVSSYLKLHLDKKRKDNPSFSLRYLAKEAKVSPSYLSQIFSKKRKLSKHLVEDLCRLMDVDNETRDKLLIQLLVESGYVSLKDGTVLESQPNFNLNVKRQNFKKFDILNPWYRIPVAEATLLSEFDGTPSWIAEHLSLDLNLVENCLKDLLCHELIEVKNGKFSKVEKNWEFGSAQRKIEIRQHHTEYLQRAAIELRENTEEQDLERRLITGMIFSLPSDRVRDFKMRLVDLMHEFLGEVQEKEVDEVYRLGIQFFPLSKK